MICISYGHMDSFLNFSTKFCIPEEFENINDTGEFSARYSELDCTSDVVVCTSCTVSLLFDLVSVGRDRFISFLSATICYLFPTDRPTARPMQSNYNSV